MFCDVIGSQCDLVNQAAECTSLSGVTYSSRNTVFEVSLESLGVGSLNGSDSMLLSQICFN